ncbi:MAG: Uma2 family endonuclease [Planctomycetia bacterium]|nr:Uma2 family endonuclease [Planctomycetia bacterium]
MSTAAVAALPKSAPAPLPISTPPRELYRFTVAKYLDLVAAGVLGPDDHVELLEGWLVQKMSRNPPHDGTLNLIIPLLLSLLPLDYVLRNQSALVLARSVPEPDLAMVRGPGTLYLKRHPRPADVGLLIEVADSSRLLDRREKGKLYAEARIPEFWLINLVETQVEVYTQPKGGKSPAYKQRQDYQAGQEVPLILNGQEVGRLAVSSLCPVKA